VCGQHLEYLIRRRRWPACLDGTGDPGPPPPEPRSGSGEGTDSSSSYHPHCQGGYRAWWLWSSTSVLVCRCGCVSVFFLQNEYRDLIYCLSNDIIISKDREWAALPSSLHSKRHEGYGTRAGSEVGDAHTSVDIPRSDRHTILSSSRSMSAVLSGTLLQWSRRRELDAQDA